MDGRAHQKTTLWLGNDDGAGDGMSANGYGFEIGSEDNMVSVESSFGNDNQAVQVFILRDLFPAIRAVMDRIDGRAAWFSDGSPAPVDHPQHSDLFEDNFAEWLTANGITFTYADGDQTVTIDLNRLKAAIAGLVTEERKHGS